MTTVDEVAAQRAKKAEFSGITGPRDVLNLALSELVSENIESVLIIGIRPDGQQFSYCGGPAVDTHRKEWLVLQGECLRVIDRMTDE